MKDRTSVASLMSSLLVVSIFVSVVSCTDTPQSQSRAAQYVVAGVERGVGKRWEDNRRFEKEVITESLKEDGIHDPENPAIESLQDPSESLAQFPADRRGMVDWVEALDQGVIQPRQSLKGKEDMLVMDMDIIFKDTGQMPYVRFPHLAHTKWLDCSNCHPAIFIPQKGANNPSMDGILAGRHCGRCHDKVAFALWVCERCHSVPHENSPEKWW